MAICCCSPAAPAAIAPLVDSCERSRRIAESLQRVLLRTHPRETLSGLSCEAVYESILDEAAVGGDSFDAFPLTGGRVALAVADASGKGLDAAERVAEVRFALRAFLREHEDARRALACLNNFVCSTQHLSGGDSCTFVTLTLIVLNSTDGAMECLCAGGEPPLILRADGHVEMEEVMGAALGLYPGLSYESAHAFLEAGDTVFLATDGITEARRIVPGDPPGCRGSSFLGTDGLARLARRAWKAQAAKGPTAIPEMCRSIVEGAREFAGGTFHDDVCLLAARREPLGESTIRDITVGRGSAAPAICPERFSA